MSIAPAHAPRVRHRSRGRLRVHVPNIGSSNRQSLEHRLAGLAGVRSAHANPLTRNVLVQFDSTRLDEATVLVHLSECTAPEDELAVRPTPGAAVQIDRPGLLPGLLKLVGAAFGGLIVLARRLGLSVPIGGTAATMAGVLAAVVSLPWTRTALEEIVGQAGTSLLCQLTELLAAILGADVLSVAFQALEAAILIGQSLAHGT